MHKILAFLVCMLSSCTFLQQHPNVTDTLEKDAVELEEQILKDVTKP